MGFSDRNEEKLKSFLAIVRKLTKSGRRPNIRAKKIQREGEKSLWMMKRLGRIENGHCSNR